MKDRHGAIGKQLIVANVAVDQDTSCPVTIRKAVRQLRDEGLVRTTPGWAPTW
jgi:DNA-binding IscR family transcriptional regulator